MSMLHPTNSMSKFLLNNIKEGHLIGLCEPSSSFYHIGVGYALYFDFIKYSIYLLISLFLISGVYNLITNITSMDCDSAYCFTDYISIMAIQNKRNHPELIEGQLVVNFLSVIFVMFYFHYIRYRFRKASIKADDLTVTPSDYTLKIKNIPSATTNEELKEWINSLSDDSHPIEIRKINRAFQILEYLDKKRKLKALQTKLLKADDTDKTKINEEITQIDTILKKYKTEKDFEFTKTSFVTFKTADQADFIKKQFMKSLLRSVIDFVTPFLNTKTRFKGTRIEVNRAPEPTDIEWQNLCYKDSTILKWRIFTAFMTLVLIGISFGLIIGINAIQESVASSSDSKSTGVQLLSILASVVITVINTSLSLSIRWLAKNEKHDTSTDYFAAVAGKLTIAQFINTALMNLLAKLVLGGGISAGLNSINFYGEGGLIINMYYVFITNALISPILTVLNPGYRFKKMKQKKILNQGKNNNLTQEQAHQLFEGVVVDVSAKYAALAKTILLTSFYASAMPMAIIYTILGLFLTFWAEKYSLLRHQQLPGAMSDDLSFSMLEYLDYSPLIFAIGNLTFAQTLKSNTSSLVFYDQSYQLIYAAIGISLAHIVFPMTLINEAVFKIKDEVTETQVFDKARLRFLTDYDIENPITKKKAQMAFLKMVARFKKRQEARKLAKIDEKKSKQAETDFKKLGDGNLNETVAPLKPSDGQNEADKSVLQNNQQLLTENNQKPLNSETKTLNDNYDDDDDYDDDDRDNEDDDQDLSLDLDNLDQVAQKGDNFDISKKEAASVKAKRLEEELKKEKEKFKATNFEASKYGSTIRDEDLDIKNFDIEFDPISVSAKKDTVKEQLNVKGNFILNFEIKPFQSPNNEPTQMYPKDIESSFVIDDNEENNVANDLKAVYDQGNFKA